MGAEPERGSIKLAAVPPEGVHALKLLFEAILRRRAREAAEAGKDGAGNTAD